MPKPSLDTAKVDAILVGAKPDEFEEILRSLDIFERGGTMSREEADIWRTRVQGWVRYRREDQTASTTSVASFFEHPTRS